jgi:cytidylate kinase
MNAANGLNRLGSTVERLSQHWESKRKKEAGEGHSGVPHFSIALEREAGTLGTSLAVELGKRLGWQVYDHELLERIAEDMGVRVALLESVDEKRQSWILESVEAFLSAPEKSAWVSSVSECAYVRHLVETVLALAAHGNCIIVGRGAAFILPCETTLRVRLVGPVTTRIANLSRTLDVSEEEASRRIQTIDRERKHFIWDHFLKDPTECRHYDMVLNVGRFSLAAEAAIIIESLNQLRGMAKTDAALAGVSV